MGFSDFNANTAQGQRTDAISKANPGRDMSKVLNNDDLFVPGVYYSAQTNDTGEGIAKKLSITTDALYAANRKKFPTLNDWTKLQVGDPIRIPLKDPSKANGINGVVTNLQNLVGKPYP